MSKEHISCMLRLMRHIKNSHTATDKHALQIAVDYAVTFYLEAPMSPIVIYDVHEATF